MAADPDVAIRPLAAADAPACDEVIRTLPNHFGDPDGRRECAEAVRAARASGGRWSGGSPASSGARAAAAAGPDRVVG